LAHHFFNENDERLVDILQGGKLTRWWTRSSPYVLPTFKTSLHPLSTMLILKAPWMLLLKSKSPYYIQDSCYPRQMAKQKVFLFKMLFYGPISGLIWWGTCNLMVLCRIVGWCLIMSSVFKNEPPWLVMFTTQCITKCSPL
jgi:hypothetical protein